MPAPDRIPAALLLTLAGCAGGGRGLTETEPASVFDHLRATYDANGDGVVTADEYDRAGGAFARLDRVPDGRIGPEDFAPRGRRPRGLAADDARVRRAAALLAWYFQDDDRPQQLEADELLLAFAAYDANGDGRVGRREFEARSHRRASLGLRPDGRLAGLLEPETTDPWERALLGLDENDDGFATAKELLAFHADHRAAFDLDLAQLERALPGRPAPDFTLPLHRAPDAVTLSDFAGQRPVALIFGSYT